MQAVPVWRLVDIGEVYEVDETNPVTNTAYLVNRTADTAIPVLQVLGRLKLIERRDRSPVIIIIYGILVVGIMCVINAIIVFISLYDAC